MVLILKHCGKKSCLVFLITVVMNTGLLKLIKIITSACIRAQSLQ